MTAIRHSLWLAPFVFSLGCASAPPPETPAPAPSAKPSEEASESKVFGVVGMMAKDAPPTKEAAPPPPPAPAPPAPPAPSSAGYSLAVRDLTDPPVAPTFDGAAAEVRQAQWAKASILLGKLAKDADQSGPIYEKLAVHALWGRVATQLKNAKKADTEYEAVLLLAKDVHEVSSTIESLGGTDEEKRHRHQTAAFAVGEAQFFFAEKKGREADAVVVPQYKGSGAREDVLAFINKEYAVWVKSKRMKVSEAETQYAKILEYHPAPHPRWVIAGANRIGQMYSRFVDEFRAAPMPKEWEREGIIPGTELSYAELRAEYKNKLVEASVPQEQQARRAFQSCVDYSTKFQLKNDDSKVCEAWLAGHPAAK